MPQRMRIFISSPGDVAEERRRAALVIRRLKREFARFFDLSAVLWEYEPMLASDHFQDIIERPSSTDLVVLILWSRLGTPLPADRYCGLDGRTPVTGTEWEFEEALAARRATGTPDILVYRKATQAVAHFSRGEELEQARAQWQALGTFWERHFEADGSFKAAFNSFDGLDRFEEQFEAHLRDLLRQRLPDRAESGPRSITWHDGSPFRGLAAFGPEHAAVFFGRERAEREVTEALARAAEGGTAFLLMLGASGIGKSSLVHAGVLPGLAAPGVVAGGESWRHCVFRPGEARGGLLEGLATALLDQRTALPELTAAGIDRAALAEQFRAAPSQSGLPIGVGLARVAGTATAARLVLVIDQMEELFTLADVTVEERSRLVAVLGALARSGLVWVVATMRSDVFHRMAELPELLDLAAGRQVHLAPARPAELEQMVRRPAEAAGLGFEIDRDGGPPLDTVLIEAAGRDPGALPLLSFALEELYRRDVVDGGGVLTFASYRALGGLEGAVARRAEEVAEAVCRPLPSVMERALAAVLRALVTVAEDGTATARTAARDEIAAVPERAAILDALVSARLAVVAGGVGGATVRLAHEALLAHWPRLSALISADGEFLRARGRLTTDGAHWRTEGRPDDLLLPSGKRLAEAEDLLVAHHDELGAAAEYVEASVRRDRFEQGRKLRRSRQLSGAMGALALLAGIGGWFAWDRSVETERQRSVAERKTEEANESARIAEARRLEAQTRLHTAQVNESRFLARTSDRVRSLGYHGAALEIALAGLPSLPAKEEGDRPVVPAVVSAVSESLYADPTEAVLKGHGKEVNSAVFSPDNKRIVTASDDGTARIWDARTGQSLLILGEHTGPVRRASFNPDGSRVLTSSDDQTARVWDARTGQSLLILGGHTAPIKRASFNRSGTRIVTTSADHTARVWDAATGNNLLILDGHSKDVDFATFSPDGTRILTASSDETVRVWDATTGQNLHILKGHSGFFLPASFSPDGKRIATGSWDGRARIWDAGTGEIIALLRVSWDIEHTVRSLAFTRDGRKLATSYSDGSVRVWDAVTRDPVEKTDRPFFETYVPESRKPLLVLQGHGSEVGTVSFAADDTILTSSADGTARVWDPESGKVNMILAGHGGPIINAEFSRGDRRVVTASEDHTARVWRLPKDGEGTSVAAVKGYAKNPHCASFSPDGRRVMVTSIDGKAFLWDGSAPDRPPHVAWTVRGNASWCASFSPDGTQVAMALNDISAAILDAATGDTLLRLRGHTTALRMLSFSPDGTRLVTTSYNGTARVWDTRTGTCLAVLEGHTDYITSVAFDAAGQRVITGSADRTARIWNVHTGKSLAVLPGHEDGASSATFTPDGRRVVTTSLRGPTRIWDSEDGRLLTVLNGRDWPISPRSFSPDGKRAVSVTGGNARIWNTETGELLQTLFNQSAVVGDGMGLLGAQRRTEYEFIHAEFSPDGTRILIRKMVGVEIWDAFSGAKLFEMNYPQDGNYHYITSAEFSRNGNQIVTTSSKGIVQVFRVDRALAFDQLRYFAPLAAMDELSDTERSQYLLSPRPRPAAERREPDPCDRRAGDPFDADRHGRGVSLRKIDAEKAIGVCREAVNTMPEQPRMRYQLGRAHEAKGQTDDAKAAYQSAADAGHPMAWYGLSRLAVRDFKASPSAEHWQSLVDLRKKAFDAGVILAAADFAEDLWSAPPPYRDRIAAVEWAGRAASAGSPTAHDWLADRYGTDDGIGKDSGKALFHRALAAKLFRDQGLDEDAHRAAAQRGSLARSMPINDVVTIGQRLDSVTPTPP